MYDVNKLFKGSSLSAQEQRDLLKEMLDEICKMIEDLDKQCLYCNTCGKYYFRKECCINFRKVTKNVCINPLAGGYLEPYEYDDREVTEFYNMCPKGHEIKGYAEYL